MLLLSKMSFSTVISKIFYFSHQYWYDDADPRTNYWFINVPFVFVIFVVCAYVWSALVGLPIVFEKYFDPRTYIDKFTYYYNLVQIIINACSFLGLIFIFRFLQNITNIDYPDRSLNGFKERFFCFCAVIYFLTKIFDWNDTLIMVAKRKPVPFIHLIHHAMVVFYGWMILRIGGLLHGVQFFVLLNSILHLNIHLYYFIAQTRPQRKFPHWKRFIWTFEFAQFVPYSILCGITLTYGKNYPREWLIIFVIQPPLWCIAYAAYYFYYRLPMMRKTRLSASSKRGEGVKKDTPCEDCKMNDSINNNAHIASFLASLDNGNLEASKRKNN